MATLNRATLAFRNLTHHWRTNLAILIGVVAGTAVIGGALIVGDSVKSSLRQMTLDRLGSVDYALSGPRFFREQLTEALESFSTSDKEMTKIDLRHISPAIVMQAGLQANSGTNLRRAGKVNVYGFDQRAWSLIDSKKLSLPEGTNVVLNARAAEAVQAKIGDKVTVWIELPSMVPRDTLLGKKDNDSVEIALTVCGIAPDESGLGRFGLLPTQSLPLNAFVDLHVLQEQLGLEETKPSRRDPIGTPGRVNAILAQGKSPANATTSIVNAVHMAWSLNDLSLRVLDNSSFQGLVFESDQMILEDTFALAARKTAEEMSMTTAPVMVYLANKIWNPQVIDTEKKTGYSTYSAVAGFDILELEGKPTASFTFVGDKPASWGEGDVIINEFLATDLQVKVGDVIKFTYHSIGSRGELPELEQSVTVRGIVAMTGTAADRTLTPHVKGITDVNSLGDWDQPFPMDLGSVTPRDDEYWDSFRAIPKMFLPLTTAKRLWPSRYGSLTSLRIASVADTPKTDGQLQTMKEQFTRKLLDTIDPLMAGFQLQPVKAIGLFAANGSTDFSGLFFGFSLFLIVAAMLLIGLLFRLSIEQRVQDLGLLGAVGFSANQVRQQMLSEGFLTSVVGAGIGTFVAVEYARLMIFGLTHWWIGAIGTKNLQLSVHPLTLVLGFLIAVLTSLLSIWWAIRHLKRLSIREQLAGVTEREVDSNSSRKHRLSSSRRARVCLAIALVLIGAVAFAAIPAAVAFFGIGVLLLIACQSFLSARLQEEKGIGVRGSGIIGHCRLGLRNAARHRQRTVMTAGMIATATFLIVAVAAFRRDPTNELPVKSSGNGGFTLVAESSSPVLYDINTPEGRKKLQLIPPATSPAATALAEMRVVPFRVKPGEDASCLNLYQTKIPTILGVPQSLIDENRFAFASGGWQALDTKHAVTSNTDAQSIEEPIPVLGDMNTLMFSLHKQVGQKIAIPNEESPQHQLVVKGMFQDSVFQGVLVMSEENFLKLFPEQKGFQYFLIEVPPAQAATAAAYLETELAEYGFDAEPVAERLARFLSVQNTYLSTFQTLGGLGLLLGTLGLATVMLRNVLERQGEFALLRAVGFRRLGIAALVLWETAFVLGWGLVAGATSALLATAPSLFGRGGELPWESLSELLFVVFTTGMLASAFAVITAVRLPIVTTLRGE